MATNGINETRTSITCENIPELFLDKLVAKSHFSRFGKIKRFILRPSRHACTVEYEDPESALKALERGGEYKNQTFSITWTDLKPASFGDNGKVGASPIDLEVQMELEAIDHTRGAPSQNVLAFYKNAERPALVTANNRPSLPKPALPPAVRTEVDPKIKQARAELETLARKPAFSAEERCRVLEAKDRYIRLTTERTTDIKKAKNIEGTCPDMCPEKERYLREWKCMVPSYEKQLGGGSQIDHVKAIKQYSRSSADQELPLPHELRSQHALGRTMHFLLTNLADVCDDEEAEGGGNVSDWFHYIWDRTRGIRKDITQQDLCSPTVVELVEQCTRFHIHCAARLVSEDPSVFDQKINTENMTKCLQTLKYMYTDLAQRGQRCPSEAEFRAYMVLLYLNDGNFLWELRQLPEAIIHSNEIQFALSVYFALEENNFVRFFQLVRSTTYMNACILLRYFTQVRQKAIDILRKAYAVRSTATFSLEYMTSILGFEDQEEADAFFDHYGIVVDETTDMVIFEPRQLNFYKPDVPFRTTRAVKLVESKRTVSIGEAICGRPLEEFEKQLSAVQRPMDSFDANGCLKEQVLEKVFVDRKETEENATPPPKPFLKDAQPSAHSIEEDKVDSSTFNAPRDETMSDDRIFKVPSPTIVVPRPLKEKMENKEQPSMALPVPKDLDQAAELEKQKQEKLKREEEEKRRRQEQREEERRKAIEKASAAELEKLLDAVVQEIVPDIADTALTRHKRLQQYPHELFDELSDEILRSLLPTIAKQENERMERIKSARAWKLSVKYFHRWHRHAQSAARWRRLMRTVPPSFVNGSIGIDQLPRCDRLRPFLNARFTAGTKRSADEVLQDRSVRREVFLFDAFPERQLIDPFVQLEGMIHQLQTLAPTRLVGLAGPICWKLVISVPAEGEEGSAGFPSFVHRWLKCCAFRKDERNMNHPYFYLAARAPPSKQHVRQSANSAADVSKEQRAICMRLLKGKSLASEKDTESSRACKLSDGLLFFLSDRCQVEEARKRLTNILAESGSEGPSVAVMLYSPNSADAGTVSVDDLEKRLGLVVGVVKRWRVFVWSKVTDNDTLREAITYLTNCYRANLQFDSPRHLERLEMRPLTDFLECCVGSELWFRLDKACRKPDGYTLAGQNGNAIVELYNSILNKVQSMVDQDLTQFVQLPEEFDKLRDGSGGTKTGKFLPLSEAYFPPDWHSSERRKQIVQLLKSLELRPLPSSLLQAIDHVAQQATTKGVASDVTQLRTELTCYLSSYRVPLDEDVHDLSTLTQRVVQGIVSQLAGYVHEAETRPTGQSVRHCYWIPILALVSETILRAVLSSRSPPLEVCYRRNEFLQHTETDWWKDQLHQVQQQAQKTYEESQANATSFSDQSRRSSFTTTTTSDRKRTHKELSQHNDSCISIGDSITSYSDSSSFSDSVRSDGGKKRTKLVNGVPYSQDIVDDVIAQGMRALARAEQMLSQRQKTTSELQHVFNPLEQTILDVEKSCRTLQYQHGKGSSK
uniref:Germinal-center associated nuclear protein n=1 Tax=Anopheles stephensi TaxID=30069 RepID=A0A182XZW9_ANOST